MSRLDEIKGRYMQHEYDFALSSADIDYLIQQAEVSKEWQIVANNTYADLIKAERRVKELEDKTNQRYKQALEEILGLDIDVCIYDYLGDVITIAAEALKGESKWQEGTKEKR